MKRLSRLHMLELSQRGIKTPGYSREQDIGIVHLGCGNFHRAHQAFYFDKLLEMGERDWMILGVSLRSSKVSDGLNPQDGLYTLVSRSCELQSPRLIGSVSKVLVAPHNPESVIRSMADKAVSLITLTVTEKGYRPALPGGQVDMEDPDVLHDIQNPETPKTAVGYLVAALARRLSLGSGPLTLLSCDNMPDNGNALKRGVIALARQRDSTLADWIERECTFPSSMVDRIVPATTADDLECFETEYGCSDRGLVNTEPFTQWVIEDTFAARRPCLEKAGVTFTNDVASWENAKLRLLNGAHSALAYLAFPMGMSFVHEAVRDNDFRNFIDILWSEASQTLCPASGLDERAYKAALIERFENQALSHRLFQIAMDGSQKLPQRILAPLLERYERGLESPALMLVVAAWMRWQFGLTESGMTFQIDDPLAKETRRLIEEAGNDPEKVCNALLSITSVFGPQFMENTDLSDQLANLLCLLLNEGSKAAIAATVKA